MTLTAVQARAEFESIDPRASGLRSLAQQLDATGSVDLSDVAAWRAARWHRFMRYFDARHEVQMGTGTSLGEAVNVFASSRRDEAIRRQLLDDLGADQSVPVSQLTNVLPADLPDKGRARVHIFQRWLCRNGWNSSLRCAQANDWRDCTTCATEDLRVMGTAESGATGRQAGLPEQEHAVAPMNPAIARVGRETYGRLTYAIAEAVLQQIPGAEADPLTYPVEHNRTAENFALRGTSLAYLGLGNSVTDSLRAHINDRLRDSEKARQVAQLAETLCEKALDSDWRPAVKSKGVSGGNTALAVATLDLEYAAVVKVDTNKKVLHEAELLCEFAKGHLKDMVPGVLAKSDDPSRQEDSEAHAEQGALHGYLMEIAPGVDLAARLTQDSTKEDLDEVKEAITTLLLGLTPWYQTALNADPTDREIIWRQYFGRVLERFRTFEHADRERVETLINKACESFDDWGPPSMTPIHGDPNPENVFWDGKRITLIDPKDWKHGDYIFDMAKIGHYFRVTAQVERGLPGGKATELENHLLERVNLMDIPGQEQERRARYELAVASCLLGIVPTRHEKATNLRKKGDEAAAEIQETLCGKALEVGLKALQCGLEIAPRHVTDK